MYKMCSTDKCIAILTNGAYTCTIYIKALCTEIVTHKTVSVQHCGMCQRYTSNGKRRKKRPQLTRVIPIYTNLYQAPNQPLPFIVLLPFYVTEGPQHNLCPRSYATAVLGGIFIIVRQMMCIVSDIEMTSRRRLS